MSLRTEASRTRRPLSFVDRALSEESPWPSRSRCRRSASRSPRASYRALAQEGRRRRQGRRTGRRTGDRQGDAGSRRPGRRACCAIAVAEGDDGRSRRGGRPDRGRAARRRREASPASRSRQAAHAASRGRVSANRRCRRRPGVAAEARGHRPDATHRHRPRRSDHQGRRARSGGTVSDGASRERRATASSFARERRLLPLAGSPTERETRQRMTPSASASPSGCVAAQQTPPS